MTTCKECNHFYDSEIPVSCSQIRKTNPHECEGMRKINGQWKFDINLCPFWNNNNTATLGICKQFDTQQKPCPYCNKLIKHHQGSYEFVLSCHPMSECFN